ncbi:MAG: SEC-C metal-binding domain-containing protein [Candidatus Zixiibacteriota bacterium]
MKARVGRNEPCPCGSGRKFKVCCGLAPRTHRAGEAESHGQSENGPVVPSDGRFRFEAGAYGGPGGYFPSVACLKRDGHGEWGYHFVLVIPDALRDDQETATLESGDHLFEAFRGRAAPESIAVRLRDFGYVSVADFRVIGGGSDGGPGFVSGVEEDS